MNFQRLFSDLSSPRNIVLFILDLEIVTKFILGPVISSFIDSWSHYQWVSFMYKLKMISIYFVKPHLGSYLH